MILSFRHCCTTSLRAGTDDFSWFFVSLPLDIHGSVVSDIKSPSSVTSTPPDTVSWQSAYWALLALSLNAMTQNSTLDRGFPSTILFPMRSSPLICAADAIEVLLRLLWYMYRARLPAQNAARHVVEETTWQPNQTGSTSTLANQYPLSHIVVFVLGVLPQAVKLFGMRGIPWTHVWASLYLPSYLVLVGVGALARRAGPTTSVHLVAFREREARLLKFGVVAAQVGVWLWCMWRVVSPVWRSIPLESPNYMPIMIPTLLIGISVPVVTFIIILFSVFPSMDSLLLSIFSLLGGVCLVIYVNMFLEHLMIHHTDSMMTFSSLVLAVVFIAVVMLFLIDIFPLNFRTIYKVFFCVGNLVFSILYYRFLYDPRGTVKPPWAEKLG